MTLTFTCLHGLAAEPYLTELAALRIHIFHDYPYLYQGSLSYETNYLRTYFEAAESLVILAKDGDRIVGASTAVPLHYEEEALLEPFHNQSINIDDVMYFGESILLSAYRGQGAGKEFFARRLAHARLHNKRVAAFCAVERETNHPARPENYRGLDAFWESQGFHKIPSMLGQLKWLDLGAKHETYKPMQFWLKTL